MWSLERAKSDTILLKASTPSGLSQGTEYKDYISLEDKWCFFENLQVPVSTYDGKLNNQSHLVLL